MEKEKEILSGFLLARSHLSNIVTRREFSLLIAAGEENDSEDRRRQVRALYRHLQSITNARIAKVQRHIDLECRLQRRNSRTPGKSSAEEVDPENSDEDDEDDLEAEFDTSLTLPQMLTRMRDMKESLEEDTTGLQANCDLYLLEMNSILGNLSDLRYGKVSVDDAKTSTLSLLETIHAKP